MSRNILSSSLQNASFNIIFQVLCRCVTFILNAWIIRHVGHEVLGIMNVRLLLLESTILFLSREPFLRSCLGYKGGRNWTWVVNQMWLSVPASVILSLVFVFVWLEVLTLHHPEYATQYKFGCWSIAISCVVELCSASVVLVSQIFCFVKLKVALDTLHIFVRTITFVLIVIYDTDMAIIAFSVAQLLSAFTITISYYSFFYWYIDKLNEKRAQTVGKIKESDSMFSHMEDFNFTSLVDFLPKWCGRLENSFDSQLRELTVSFVKQGFVKQLLTEGEKYVMSISPVLSFAEQATYDVVNNLGSLAARFIFRPIEDSSYFYFTQMVKRETPMLNQDSVIIAETCTVLCQICKVVTSIGLIVFIFGQSYSRTLLLLYGGESFIESGLPVQLMRMHCLAIVLLAVNGITECFTFATMSSAQLNKYNYVMVFFSVTFLFLSYLLTNIFGPIGFIVSNCVNMTARILHSLYFIENKFKGTGYKPLEGLATGKTFILTLVVAGILCKISEIRLSKNSQLLHILFGIPCVLTVLIIWAYENYSLIQLLVIKYQSKGEKLKKS